MLELALLEASGPGEFLSRTFAGSLKALAWVGMMTVAADRQRRRFLRWQRRGVCAVLRGVASLLAADMSGHLSERMETPEVFAALSKLTRIT